MADDVMRCSCGQPAGMGHSPLCSYGADGDLTEQGRQLEAARKLLIDWVAYSVNLGAADITALPERLMGRTVGFLDATAV